MKKLIFFLIVIIPALVKAQATASDTAGVKTACENYVGGFYTSDTNRIVQGVHVDLVKRIVAKKMDYKLMEMTRAQLVQAAQNPRHMTDPNPSEPFKITVSVFDITNDIAIAKITTNKMPFFDYAQLGKINGEWKVINVLWAMNH